MNNNIFNNNIDIDKLQAMWAKLQSVCSHIGQGVMYLIFQKLFDYTKITKPKGYDKTITSVFANVRILTKHHKAALILNRIIYNAIVIAFDSIYDDFEPKRPAFLK